MEIGIYVEPNYRRARATLSAAAHRQYQNRVFFNIVEDRTGGASAHQDYEANKRDNRMDEPDRKNCG